MSITGYGMSETCPILTLGKLKPHMLDWDDEQQITVRCRTGAPLPLVNLQVVDVQGNKLPRDGASTGEVVVRSPWLTQGYFKDPQTLRGTLDRRLAAHLRHRLHRRRRLSAGDRPHQGRDQDRRRMDFLAGAGRHRDRSTRR